MFVLAYIASVGAAHGKRNDCYREIRLSALNLVDAEREARMRWAEEKKTDHIYSNTRLRHPHLREVQEHQTQLE